MRYRALPDPQLPQLGIALDAAAMDGVLRASFPALASRRFATGEWHITYAHYRPGRGCVVRYETTLHDKQRNSASPFFVAGTMVAAEHEPAADQQAERCLADFVRHHRPWELGAPAARDERLRMRFQTFPMDAALPGIAHALAATSDETCGVVSYKPWLRCVLRVTQDGVRQYAKFYPDESGARLHVQMQALRMSLRENPALNVARPVGYVPEWRMLVQAEAPGEPVLDRWRRARDERALAAHIETVALALAVLHTTPLPPGAHHHLLDEVASLREDVRAVAMVAGPLAGRLSAALDGVADWAMRAPAEASVCAHGAFRHDQVLLGAARATILDFDTCVRADPAMDVGNFLAYVRRLSLRRSISKGMLDLVRRQFVDAYRRANPSLDEERAAAYELASLVKIAVRYVYGLRPDDAQRVLCLLDEAGEHMRRDRSTVSANA